MTGTELSKLIALRATLRGSGLFCFEKDGKYFLYRQIENSRNAKVHVRSNIDTFVRDTNRILGGS